MNDYKICSNCVMDTSDSRIQFDHNGVCDHCNIYYSKILPKWHTDKRGQDKLSEIIEKIHVAQKNFDGLIINPAAFTHTSVAILDALKTCSKPKIEIHLSNIYNREDYRKNSITASGVNGIICGFGSLSYILAI